MNLDCPIPSSDQEWDKIAEMSMKQSPLEGFNNYNYVIHVQGKAWFKIRKPIPNRDEMDLRLFPEGLIQKYLYQNKLRVPNVIYISPTKNYHVQEYLPVPIVDDLFPRLPKSSRLPKYFIPCIVDFYSRLFSLPFDPFRPYLINWVKEGNSNDFLDRVIGFNQAIYAKFSLDYLELYRQLGIPENPILYFQKKSHKLTDRPFTLCHSDIHRKNCLLVEKTIWIIDWELALVADPCYDLSVHLAKVVYLPDEEERFLNLVYSKIDSRYLAGFSEDYKVYRDLECLKAVMVDSIRYHKLIIGNKISRERQDVMFNQMERKLSKAESIIGCKPLKSKEISRLFLKYES